jgi:hypothetical protein
MARADRTRLVVPLLVVAGTEQVTLRAIETIVPAVGIASRKGPSPASRACWSSAPPPTTADLAHQAVATRS